MDVASAETKNIEEVFSIPSGSLISYNQKKSRLVALGKRRTNMRTVQLG